MTLQALISSLLSFLGTRHPPANRHLVTVVLFPSEEP